jgi:chromate transporter
VVFAAYRIGSRALKNAVLWAMAAAAFVAIFALNVPFPYIVLAAGVIGYFGGRIAPNKFKTGGHHGDGQKGHGPALIDDHTPPPEHARFRWARVITYGAVGLLIWFGVMAVLFVQFGWQGGFTQMGWFFTKAALVTFGGAYAVLPYVYQGGVEHYQWLTGIQMIDGLALGETTPGPLIMVVAFVGFVGGWTKELFGPESLALAGMAGATVATFFTFLPSFLFILLGAPMIETTRGDVKFTSPLTGITPPSSACPESAVFFAYHVVAPGVLSTVQRTDAFTGFEWFSALIGVLAFIALWRFKIGIIPVIGVCGLVGLGYALIKPIISA